MEANAAEAEVAVKAGAAPTASHEAEVTALSVAVHRVHLRLVCGIYHALLHVVSRQIVWTSGSSVQGNRYSNIGALNSSTSDLLPVPLLVLSICLAFLTRRATAVVPETRACGIKLFEIGILYFAIACTILHFRHQ